MVVLRRAERRERARKESQWESRALERCLMKRKEKTNIMQHLQEGRTKRRRSGLRGPYEKTEHERVGGEGVGYREEDQEKQKLPGHG